ncbi:hypothetical protein LCGC14_1101930 [marine sediment metagenome]|uniref:Resolvase HTH domain-containing protein n=1 Tax=marine sediment metagenome TaxID=412755 RepID=A0A0F9PSH2_9ZZZZ
MNNYAHLREKAAKLRQNGYSINDICKRLNKGKGTVWYWIKDVEMLKTNVFLDRKKRKNKKAAIAAARAVKKKFKDIHKAAEKMAIEEWKNNLKDNFEFQQFIMLYWCEGCKKTKHYLSVSNSDPQLIKFALKWLRNINYHNKKIEANIQLHVDQNEENVKTFWRQETDINEIKVQRKSNSGKMSGRNWNSKYGVLSLRLSDAYLKTKIDKWIELLGIKLTGNL